MLGVVATLPERRADTDDEVVLCLVREQEALGPPVEVGRLGEAVEFHGNLRYLPPPGGHADDRARRRTRPEPTGRGLARIRHRPVGAGGERGSPSRRAYGARSARIIASVSASRLRAQRSASAQ